MADRPQWRWWLLWTLGVVLTVAASWVTVVVVAFVNGPTCDSTATAANRNGGVLGLCVVFAVLSAPWWAVALRQKDNRWRLLIGWALGILLLAGFTLTHLTVRSWASVSGGFCF